MKQTGTELVHIKRAKNIPGSTYVEATLEDPGFIAGLDQYRTGLRDRNIINLQTTEAASPDRELFATEIEYQLLKTFLGQLGYVNFVDFHAERPLCGRNLGNYIMAKASFQAGLGLPTQNVC